MKTVLNTITGILIGVLLAGIIWYTSRPPRGEAVTLQPPPEAAPITVHITGAVVSPGIHQIPDGSRVGDAIEAAGGFLPLADQENLNLAALVEDGSKINVEKRNSAEGGSGGARVNINTASLEELDTLPGIGPSTAQAIIDHRQQFGYFQRTDEIMNVSGIGPSTYERIEDLITVE